MRSSSVSVRSLFGHVSIVIQPLLFYLSRRIGNSFPKRVLIRKKPAQGQEQASQEDRGGRRAAAVCTAAAGCCRPVAGGGSANAAGADRHASLRVPVGTKRVPTPAAWQREGGCLSWGDILAERGASSRVCVDSCVVASPAGWLAGWLWRQRSGGAGPTALKVRTASMPAEATAAPTPSGGWSWAGWSWTATAAAESRGTSSWPVVVLVVLLLGMVMVLERRCLQIQGAVEGPPFCHNPAEEQCGGLRISPRGSVRMRTFGSRE
jgi:hypothetical protein